MLGKRLRECNITHAGEPLVKPITVNYVLKKEGIEVQFVDIASQYQGTDDEWEEPTTAAFTEPGELPEVLQQAAHQ